MAGFPGITKIHRFAQVERRERGEKKKSKESQFMIIFIPERDDAQ